MTSRYDWGALIEALRQQPAGTMVQVLAHEIAHPIDVGMRSTVALPLGQQADFLFVSQTDGTLSHVQQYDGYYLLRIVPPPTTPVMAVAPSSPPDPAATLLATTALGALFGLLGGTRQSVIAGALVGGTLGLVATAVREAESSPETARLAADLATTFARVAVQRTPVTASSKYSAPAGAARVTQEVQAAKPLPARTPSTTLARGSKKRSRKTPR